MSFSSIFVQLHILVRPVHVLKSQYRPRLHNDFNQPRSTRLSVVEGLGDISISFYETKCIFQHNVPIACITRIQFLLIFFMSILSFWYRLLCSFCTLSQSHTHTPSSSLCQSQQRKRTSSSLTASGLNSLFAFEVLVQQNRSYGHRKHITVIEERLSFFMSQLPKSRTEKTLQKTSLSINMIV